MQQQTSGEATKQLVSGVSDTQSGTLSKPLLLLIAS